MFEPQDPDYQQRALESFHLQKAMKTMNVSVQAVEPGQVTLSIPYQDKLTQQNGFLHAGVITTVVDSACGYAAFTLMPKGASVLSVEFKINLLRPAIGETFKAIGRVRKAGKTITVVEGDFIAINQGNEKLVATMNGTMMTLMPN